MGARSSALDGFGDDFAWSLFDAAPDGVLVVAASGDIVFVNDPAGDLFRCRTADLLGRPVEDLVPTDVRATHRARRERYEAAPTVRPMGAGLLLRAQRPDGTEFHAEISLSPLRLGGDGLVVAAVRDVSDRVADQDRLRKVLHTLDASDDGIFIFDSDTLRYSYVNDGAVRLVGYDASELASMAPMDLNPHVDDAEFRDLIAQLLDEPDATVRRTTSLRRKDGTDVPVENSYQSTPPDRDGARSIVVLSRDISDRLAAEDAVRRSEDALRDAERKIVIADERDRIARDLHDTVIQRLFGTGLSLQAVSSVADERVRLRLDSAIADLDEMILDLRTTIFSLQSHRALPDGLRGRLLDVTEEAGRSLGFEPRVQFDGPIDNLDEPLAEHLVPSLREALSNVAKHARATRVRVSVEVGEDVVLIVTDDGVGMGGEVFGGSGLENLRDRARSLGGGVELSSPIGGGCRLEWRVPVKGATDPDPVG